jgi:O-antigen/teichoic acid export membrane protein
MAMDSLSTWPVVNSLFFLFSSIALSFQEAVVAQAGRSRKNIPVLVKFGLILMAALAGLFLLITMTGGSRFWFRVVAGLPPSLVDLAQPAMYILIVLPVAVTLRSLLSGILVAREKTGFLTIAVSANTVVLLTLVVVLPRFTDLVGTIVAAIALVSAVTAQALVLWLGNYLSRRTARRINGPAVPAAS